MLWYGNTAVVQLFEWFSAARNHSVIFIVESALSDYETVADA